MASVKHEYQTLTKLHHPNVVRVLGWVSSQGGARHGFLMHLATGNLWQWVNRTCGDGVNHTRGDGVSAMVQIARGLSYVHHAGIVHLDMKPENVINFEPAGRACLFQIADLGVCMGVPNADIATGGRVASHLVNADVYRPLHLWYAAGSLISVQCSFDLWAFGCIVFDVLQRHPRLRNQDGHALRLFSGVKRKGRYADVLRVRNYRLVNRLDEDVVAVVVRFQPDWVMGRGGDRLMSAELVRVLMGLHH